MATINYKFYSRLKTREERLQSILRKNGKSDYSDLHNILLDTEDLQFLFQVSARTLDTWKKNRLLPYNRRSGKNFYRLEAVHRLLLNHRVTGASSS